MSCRDRSAALAARARAQTELNDPSTARAHETRPAAGSSKGGLERRQRAHCCFLFVRVPASFLPLLSFDEFGTIEGIHWVTDKATGQFIAYPHTRAQWLLAQMRSMTDAVFSFLLLDRTILRHSIRRFLQRCFRSSRSRAQRRGDSRSCSQSERCHGRQRGRQEPLQLQGEERRTLGQAAREREACGVSTPPHPPLCRAACNRSHLSVYLSHAHAVIYLSRVCVFAVATRCSWAICRSTSTRTLCARCSDSVARSRMCDGSRRMESSRGQRHNTAHTRTTREHAAASSASSSDSS